MIILPVGVDGADLNRYPWVTLIIIGLCTLIWLVGLNKEDRSEEYLKDYIFYHINHPYLEQDPQHREYIDFSVMEEELEELTTYISQSNEEDFSLADTETLQSGDFEMEQARFQELGDLMVQSIEDSTKWGLKTSDPRPLQLVSHIFMHADFWHLLGNMLFLYCMGTFVEDRYGRLFFAIFYFLAGIISGYAYSLHYADTTSFLIGASGAISGVMAAFLIMFHRAHIVMRIFIFYFFRYTFNVRAWLLIPFFFVSDLFFAWVGSGNVAHWAHVWGFVFGLTVSLGLRSSGLEKKLNPMGIDFDNDPEHNPLAAARNELQNENPARAIEILIRGMEDMPEFEDQAKMLWQMVLNNRLPEQNEKMVQVLIENALQLKHPEGAAFYWRQYREQAPAYLMPHNLAIRLARMLLAENDPSANELAVDILSSYIAEARAIRSVTLMAMARLLGKTNPQAAARLLDQGLTSDRLSEHERRELATQSESYKKSAPGQMAAPRPAVEMETRENREPTYPYSAPFSSADLVNAGPDFDDFNLFGEGLALASDPDFGVEQAEDQFTRAVDESQQHSVSLDETLSVTLSPPVITAYEVVPESIDRTGLKVAIKGRDTRRVRYDQIHAMALAAVRQQNGKPTLVVDLVMDSPDNPERRIRVMRIQSSSFNPLKLFPQSSNPMQALTSFNRTVLRFSGALMLPNDLVFAGKGITTFGSESEMEAAIYGNL